VSEPRLSIPWDALRFDERGLIPVIVQDVSSGDVLMFAFANREALIQTVQTGEAHFYSRSRQALWRKGATSGNVQRVVRIRYDCDGDCLLYEVEMQGPACHEGTPSCFHRTLWAAEAAASPGRASLAVLTLLERVIARRDRERPEGSYTTYLFDKGLDKILKKVGEEASEVIIAAKNASPDELRYEAADLLYHLLVLLRAARVPLEAVLEELAARHKPS